MPSLQLDTSLLYSSQEPQHGISQATEKITAEQIERAVATVNQRIGAKEYGFISCLENSEIEAEIDTVISELRWAATLVVVGIGGSDLGGRAIQQAFDEGAQIQQVLFHGDSTDPVQLTRLLAKINLEKTVFIIVSKSGGTVETMAQYFYFKHHYQQSTENWQQHFLFITDPEQGLLRKEASEHHIQTVSIPENVGGRFSVLTAVGLFPAAAMGVATSELIAGAQEVVLDSSLLKMAQIIASTQYQLFTQGTKLVVMMPYSVQLEEFARWFRQLWAESLGKDGTGILPIQARGPADQHSQLQFYAQGEAMLSHLFIRIEKRHEEVPLPEISAPEFAYLEGHSLHELVNVEQQATAVSLADLGRPSATLIVSELNERAMGQLFMLFELAVVYLAEMLGVNAFDQPGVEASKQIVKKTLSRQ